VKGFWLGIPSQVYAGSTPAARSKEIAMLKAEEEVINLADYYKPNKRQWLAHQSSALVTGVGGAKGGGKTVFLVREGLELSLDVPGNVGFICRHEASSFIKNVLPVMEKFIPRKLIREHNRVQKYMIINTDIPSLPSRIYYGGLRPTRGVSPLDRIKGFGGGLGWFAIDEASETEEQFFLMLLGELKLNLLDRHGKPMIHRAMISTNPEPGWVYRRFIKNLPPDHSFIPFLPKDNPFLPKDYVKRLRANYPPDWVLRYLEGIWAVESDTNRVIPYLLLQKTIDLPESENGPIRLAVDVARFGGDRSVIARSRGPKVKILWSKSHTDMMVVAEKAVQEYRREVAYQQAQHKKRIEAGRDSEPNKVDLIIDAVGLGAGVVDRVREMDNSIRVTEYIGGASAMEPDRFINLRAETWWKMRKMLENGEVCLPDEDELHAELTAPKYSIRSDQKIAIESKEDLKKRGFRSPDKADAVTMLFGAKVFPKLDILMLGGRR